MHWPELPPAEPPKRKHRLSRESSFFRQLVDISHFFNHTKCLYLPHSMNIQFNLSATVRRILLIHHHSINIVLSQYLPDDLDGNRICPAMYFFPLFFHYKGLRSDCLSLLSL